MGLAGGTDTVKELFQVTLSVSHKKGRGAKSILFEKLIYLGHSDREGISNYIEKFRGLSQRLANMGRICENWWLVYLLFSGLGNFQGLGSGLVN